MKRFLHDTQGNASLWSAFIMIVLIMLAVVVYSAATLYSTYQAVQTELERAANISIDANLDNANVRDLILDIPAEDAIQEAYDNLAQAGYSQNSDANWERVKDGKICYSLKDLQVLVSGKELDITASLNMPLPWASGSLSSVNIPIHVESRALYLD